MDEQLSAALSAAKLELTQFDPSKKKSVFLATKTSGMTVLDFGALLRTKLQENDAEFDHVEIYKLAKKPADLEPLIEEHAKATGTMVGEKVRVIPEDYAKYQLNMDTSESPVRFFVTDKDEMLVPHISGDAYMKVFGLKPEQAASEEFSRHVVPEYNPRRPSGVSPVREGNQVRNIFNTYIPPLWVGHERFKTDCPKIPELYMKVIQHVIPKKSERGYFYAWLYMSLFKRAPTFLVLCGIPGVGKGRIMALARALHGHSNSPPGKKSNIVDKFNSQMDGTTLLWFDELSYDEKMENTMKEMPNETMSIERKGADPKTAKVYASMAITNNNHRDNFIRFDSRKFVPLVLGTTELGESMTDDEIKKFVAMTDDQTSDTFDVGALAEFAKWLKKHGPGYAAKYRNMEYKGPMFWTLAHSSMSKWQEVVITFLTIPEKFRTARMAPDDNGYFLWSKYEPTIKRQLKHYNWPHMETIRKFLNLYRDKNGRQVFKTRKAEEVGSDFYFKFIPKGDGDDL